MFRSVNGLVKLLICVCLVGNTAAVYSVEPGKLSAAELTAHVQQALEAELK